jgi:predicted MPP superfamily phosphohydrolase
LNLLQRRDFLKIVGAAAASGLGGWLVPERLVLRTYTTRIPAFTPRRPVRIAHLSDLHASPSVPGELIEEAILRAVTPSPDLIFVTGDFITHQQPYDRTWYVRVLSRLAAAAPTFASLGNHDGKSRRFGVRAHLPVTDMVQEAGMHLLLNASSRVIVGGAPLNVVGLGDYWAQRFAPATAFAEMVPGPTILLSHNPDSKRRLGRYRWDLMLSGHTHGGQIRVPGLGAPWAPVGDTRYIHGLKPWGDRQIHVSGGIGYSRLFRYNCPPEVSVLTLET